MPFALHSFSHPGRRSSEPAEDWPHITKREHSSPPDKGGFSFLVGVVAGEGAGDTTGASFFKMESMSKVLVVSRCIVGGTTIGCREGKHLWNLILAHFRASITGGAEKYVPSTYGLGSSLFWGKMHARRKVLALAMASLSVAEWQSSLS